MFIAYPIACDPEYNDVLTVALSDEIILPLDYFRSVMEDFEDESVLYVTLTNTHNEKKYLVTLGAPHQQDKKMIFVPAWILDLLQYDPLAEMDYLRIEKADSKELPVASTIIIKPLDPLAFANDLIDCFEKAFVNLHSIEEHITIPVQLDDGIVIFAYIEKVEPAPLARIVSGEVNVEFLHDFAEIPMDLPLIDNFVQPESIELSPEERRKRVRDSWTSKMG